VSEEKFLHSQKTVFADGHRFYIRTETEQPNRKEIELAQWERKFIETIEFAPETEISTKEVLIQEWYQYPFNGFMRAADRVVSEKQSTANACVLLGSGKK